MAVTIDRLAVRLPAASAERGGAIVEHALDLAAEGLGRAVYSHELTAVRLRIEAPPEADDAEVARLLARRLVEALA